MKVLVADDDVVSRTLAVRLLEKMGYTVKSCTDGAEALEIMSAPDAPMIAIFDWMMPSIDGPDVIRMVREIKDIYPYLILLTNRTDTTDIIEGLGSGADDYIVKPVKPGELKARVKVGERILTLQKNLDEKTKVLIRLEREQKSISLAKMAGGVAHLMNNKLQTVIGYLDLLGAEFEERNLLGDEERVFLNRTRRAALEASDIGKKMLFYLSQNQGVQEMLCVRALLQKVINETAGSFPLISQARIEAPDEAFEVMGNPDELKQVLHEIIINAMEASPETVPTFKIERQDCTCCLQPPPGFPCVCTRPQDNTPVPCSKITIQDQGAGIPESQLDQIFDPFFTTKFTGRGLGLPVAMGVVKKLGGGIRISCPPSGGVIAEICLPLLTDNQGRYPQTR